MNSQHILAEALVDFVAKLRVTYPPMPLDPEGRTEWQPMTLIIVPAYINVHGDGRVTEYLVLWR